MWVKIFLLGSLWSYITDFITGLFALIPQFIYFFYTCIASLVDLCQFLVRKFAGLDTYYIGSTSVEGDVLSELINGILGIGGSYSALSTVFWSLIIFGVIIMILATIISVIKAHYNYDEKKSHPKAIIGKAIKALANFAIVPVCVVLGIMLSNYLLQALDDITSSSSNARMEQVYASSEQRYTNFFAAGQDQNGQTTYYSFDFFGVNAPTSQQTFSGMIFEAAAYECNRVRYGGFTASSAGETWSDFGMFNSNLSNANDQREAVASMIDFAFANNLQTINRQTASVLLSESSVLISSFRFLQSGVWYLGTINFNNFSKYNVGLVWYYYNLWSFNFVLGFVGIVFAISVLGSIVLGLAARILQCVALFLIYGPIIGITPLDDGNAFKQWRKTFVSNVLMAFSAIVGFNLLFLLLPYFQAITFFAPEKVVLNNVLNTMLIIALLVSVKKLISLISSLIGTEDASAAGASIKSELSKPMKSAIGKTVKVASFAAKFVPVANAAMMAARKVADAVRKKAAALAQAKAAKEGSANVSRGTYAELQRQNDEEARQPEEEAEELKGQLDEKVKEAGGDEKALKEKAKSERSAADEDEEKRAEAQERADNAKAEADELKRQLDEENAILDIIGRSHTADEHERARSHISSRYQESGMSEEDADRAASRAIFTRSYLSEGASRRDALQSELDDKNTEAAAAQDEADDLAASRDSHIAEATKAEDQARDIADLRSQYEAKQQEVSDIRDKMKQYNVRQHPIAKSALDIGGQVFKVAGSSLGFDGFLEALKKETDVMDDGKMAVRTFAQALGNTTITKNKKFRTSKEDDDIKKAEAQERATISDGNASRTMLAQAQALEEALKRLKH